MMSALSLLAKRGEVDRLSVQFSQFIFSQSKDTSQYIVAAIAGLLSEQALQGHVCVELDRLEDFTWFVELLSTESPHLLPVISDRDLCRQQLLSSNLVSNGETQTPLVIDHDRLYLNRYWAYEKNSADQITRRSRLSFQLDEQQLASDLQTLFPGATDSDQKNAAETAARFAFSVISGGPGTGKTTTVVKILSLLINATPDTRIALAAPTGKAAARMLASIQHSLKNQSAEYHKLPAEAYTIHRLLGYRQGNFEFGSEHPLPFDCIVIDEASMIDIAMMHRLLEACPADCRLILLGDRDQLASVAAGNVLGDITGHGLPLEKNTTELQHCIALLQHSRRFDKNSGIAALAKFINEGNADEAIAVLQQQQTDVTGFFDSSGKPMPELMERIIKNYNQVVEAPTVEEALKAFDEFRVLCASNHGSCGVNQLNKLIGDQLAQNAAINNGDLYQGQTVLVTQNDRSTGLFNGDTGVIWHRHGMWYACFRDQQGETRQIPVNRLPVYQPAWASTVHKSQGSEFATVLLFLPEDIEPVLLCREMLYTAVTRSTDQFILQTTEAAFRQAVNRVTSRTSGLAQRLGWPATDTD